MLRSITSLISSITCWTAKTVTSILLFIILSPLKFAIQAIKLNLQYGINQAILEFKITCWMFAVVLIWALTQQIPSGGGQRGGNKTVEGKFNELTEYTQKTLNGLTPDKFTTIVKDIQNSFGVDFKKDTVEEIYEKIKTNVKTLLDSYFKDSSEPTTCPRESEKDIKAAKEEYERELETEKLKLETEKLILMEEGLLKGGKRKSNKSRKARKSKKSRKSKKTRKNKKTRNTKKR